MFVEYMFFTEDLYQYLGQTNSHFQLDLQCLLDLCWTPSFTTLGATLEGLSTEHEGTSANKE